MEDLWDDMENDDFEEIIDVILGIREDVKMYSRSVVRYLYQFLGQFTRNYTQTTKRGLLTTNKG